MNLLQTVSLTPIRSAAIWFQTSAWERRCQAGCRKRAAMPMIASWRMTVPSIVSHSVKKTRRMAQAPLKTTLQTKLVSGQCPTLKTNKLHSSYEAQTPKSQQPALLMPNKIGLR